MEWSGELLKAIIFPKDDKLDAATIWREVTGQEPDDIVKKTLPPHSVAAGTWREYALIVTAQAGRIEAALRCVDPDPTGPTPIPEIPPASMDAAFELIRDAADGLQRGRPSVRFAFQAQLVRKVDDTVSGVAVLNELLDGIFPEDTENALYQINVRRAFTANGEMEMNRLMKWGVAALTDRNILIDAKSGAVVEQGELGKRTYAYLHLDINNRPLDDTPSESETSRILDELWTETKKLGLEGKNAL